MSYVYFHGGILVSLYHFNHSFLFLASTALLKCSCRDNQDFPRGPVVKTQCFHCRGYGFHPCSGNLDPICHVAWPNTKQQTKTAESCQIQRSSVHFPQLLSTYRSTNLFLLSLKTPTFNFTLCTQLWYISHLSSCCFSVSSLILSDFTLKS